MEKESEDPASEPVSDGKDGIFIKVGRRTIRLAWSEVSWVEVVSGSRSLRIHTTTGNHYLMPGTLKRLDVLAAEHGLMRISKAIMVSISQVKELRRRSDGYFVYLGTAGRLLQVSRRKTPKSRKMLRERDVTETK